MVLHTHQYFACGAAQARIRKLCVALGYHLLKVRSELPIACGKAYRVLPHRQALIVQMIQCADAPHPAQRPGLLLRIAARQGQVISTHVGPTKSE